MSDPTNPERRPPRDPDPRPDVRSDDVPPRRGGGASMVLWILLLLAIIATAWYFLGRDDAGTVPEPTPIGETVPEPSQSPVSTAPAPRDTTPERARPAAPIDRDARPLTQTPPEYPATALRSGIEGTVLVLVEVGADGVPTDVSVARRSSSRDLDRAALQAVRGWRFEPAMRDGKAVESSVQVPVDFRLETR
ncbi:energy transducer TonB [Luteimonas saliphila]|uniref:energy transducer TonB n=1 Tax=Luteimonas saliphila TaxID=2804919 RepID=UPI00192D7B78|nr:energy transducer TonB [Luteimonas saliphila]